VTKSISGNVTTIARNGSTVVSYSTSGNTIVVNTPMGVTKTVVYSGTDTLGKVASVTIGGSTWSYAFTDTSAVVTAPNGTTQILTTNISGITGQSDEQNRVTHYEYASGSWYAPGNLLKTIPPGGSSSTGGFTAYEYDVRGNVTKVSVVPKNGASNGVGLAEGLELYWSEMAKELISSGSSLGDRGRFIDLPGFYRSAYLDKLCAGKDPVDGEYYLIHEGMKRLY